MKTKDLLCCTAALASSLLASAAFAQGAGSVDRTSGAVQIAQGGAGDVGGGAGGGAGDVGGTGGAGGAGDVGGGTDTGAGGAGGGGDMGGGAGGAGDMGGAGGGGDMGGGGGLPATGGDPLSLIALGTVLSGVGVALRRRRSGQ